MASAGSIDKNLFLLFIIIFLSLIIKCYQKIHKL